MTRYIYTRPDGGVSIIIPAPKTDLERVLGPLTDTQYKDHVLGRSIPDDASNVRELSQADYPTDREFREAWEDSQPGTQIDVSCTKAKEIQLKKLRAQRDALLQEKDKEYLIALEKDLDTNDIKTRKQELRSMTDPLKALDTSGKYNDDVLLEQIKSLGIIS